MYEILKVINNNMVSSIDEDGQEVLLRGLGIGFKKKANDLVDDEKVEKIYKITNPSTRGKMQELLAEIPTEYIEVSTEIIEHAKLTLKKQLNESIYLVLTDHISFAMDRLKQGQLYKNALLVEIKRFYPMEYEIGLEALSIIEERLGQTLPVDEAGFIALHIVNAELDTKMSDMVHITELISEILNIIRTYYEMDLDEETLEYDRLITHLKFFGQRLFNNKKGKQEDQFFCDMIRKQYPKDYECAMQIREYIETTYRKEIGEEEMIFLTVHLKRITG